MPRGKGVFIAVLAEFCLAGIWDWYIWDQDQDRDHDQDIGISGPRDIFGIGYFGLGCGYLTI